MCEDQLLFYVEIIENRTFVKILLKRLDYELESSLRWKLIHPVISSNFHHKCGFSSARLPISGYLGKCLANALLVKWLSSIHSVEIVWWVCSGQNPLWESTPARHRETRPVIWPLYQGYLLRLYYGVPEHVLFRSKNCSHYSKSVIVIRRSIKVIVYRCPEQKLFRSLNKTRYNADAVP